MEDYRQFYHSESYLFETVRCRFVEEGSLSAFDFFFIVIWKANRAKSKIAKLLLSRDKVGNTSLELIVRHLTGTLAKQPTSRDKMFYLMEEWGFRLPLASAILTVLYPDEFTIYDTRVCDILGAYHNLCNLKFDSIWEGYQDFIEQVEKKALKDLSLRDKDRYLWGQSFYEQLTADIDNRFGLHLGKE